MAVSPQLWRDLAFGDETAWRAFLMDHADLHTRMYQSLAVTLGTVPYSAHPLADGGAEAWLWNNQLEHQGACVALALPGPPDLVTVDLTKPQAFRDWCTVHALDHLRLNSALGFI